MTATIAVVDASALLRALDPDGETARRALVALATERQLCAPMLVVWQMGSVVHRKHPARYGATHEDRQESLSAALSAVGLIHPDDDAIRKTGDLAETHGMSFYDAAYLELALRDGSSILLTVYKELRMIGRRALGADRSLDVDEAARLEGRNDPTRERKTRAVECRARARRRRSFPGEDARQRFRAAHTSSGMSE